MGLLTLGLLWPLALIWAFTRPQAASEAEPEQRGELQSLSKRVQELEERDPGRQEGTGT